MKRIIVTLSVFFLGVGLLYGSNLHTAGKSMENDYPDEKKDVMNVINQLFDGMRKGDSALVSAVFDKNVRMASIDARKGTPTFREGSLQRFLDAVGTPHENVWDERIWDPVIRIDGAMASVWVSYAFYLDDQFSHCGVNAFQLFKGVEGWKIINLTDTRRKDNCQQP